MDFQDLRQEDHQPPERACRVLITAACRSGTKYTSECFKRCGVNATHETVFQELGFNGWRDIELEVSCWVPHYHTGENTENVFLVHQTRNPLDSINSNAAHWEHLLRDQFYPGFRNLNEQADHVKFPRLLRYKQPYEKALAYYVYQNSYIENRLKPRMRVKVEDAIDRNEGGWVCWLRFDPLGRESLGDAHGEDARAFFEEMESIDKSFNQLPDYVARQKFNADFEDLPDIPEKKSLEEMIERYGYAV